MGSGWTDWSKVTKPCPCGKGGYEYMLRETEYPPFEQVQKVIMHCNVCRQEYFWLGKSWAKRAED